MTPRMALSRILTGRRDAEHWRRHAADQTRLNGELARVGAAKDRRITDLENALAAERERLKALKDDLYTRNGLVITEMFLLGRAQHETRKVRAELAAAQDTIRRQDAALMQFSHASVDRDFGAVEAAPEGGEAA